MATEVIMPKAGMAMEYGTVVKWLKKEGDPVQKGEPIIEILTDKVNMEIEAEVSGTLLKILAHEGDELPVMTVIGYIGEAGEAISIAADAKAPATAADHPEAAKKSGAETAPGVKTASSMKTAPGDAPMYDVIVIGGGPAGYVSAIRAAQLGGKVALIERDEIGGTCLNRGCIPTKTYLKNAEIVEQIHFAAQRGIHIADSTLSFDMEKIVKDKNEIVRTLTGGVKGLLKSYGVKVYSGEGKLHSATEVAINGKTDGNIRVKADKIILAGGSDVARIPIPGADLERVLDSTRILDLKTIPKKLVIVGGGVIGVEIAMVFRAYGTEVTIVEMLPHVISMMDETVYTAVEKHLKKQGVKLLTGTGVEAFEANGDGLKIKIKGGAPLEADYALMAIGRSPDLSGLGEIGIQTEKNRVKVDGHMETSVKGIYAPGDINGLSMLAHSAFRMGEVAAENAMGHTAEMDFASIPSCIYTHPEIGAVGLNEAEARKKHDVSVGMFYFAANGRALAAGETTGFVKVIVEKKYGQILGVHIFGPAASEMINEAAALMAGEITAYEVAETVHAHPSYSEAFMEACADALGRSVHLPKK
ncbi:MAG: dihydrolipoamide dehydrogenase [Clostridiales bacterium]|jgi:dihydrolipoamide dehydrogenase|nr:dihydrolipoamide dehydrogenase [Clostridiales bacterium]